MDSDCHRIDSHRERSPAVDHGVRALCAIEKLDGGETMHIVNTKEMNKMLKRLASLTILFAAAAVFAQTSGSVAVQSATVTLNPNQLSSLKAASFVLVAAPGVGKVIAPISMVVQYKAGTAPYVIPSGGSFNFTLGPRANGEVVSEQIASAGFIDQTANHVRLKAAANIGDSQTLIENQDLRLSNDGAAEWIDGDGTITITVSYSIVTLQ
jgi:hypothetical protein